MIGTSRSRVPVFADGMMMKRNDGNLGFWAPGFSIFEDGMEQEERDRLAPLKAELEKTTDPTRKAQLKEEEEE